MKLNSLHLAIAAALVLPLATGCSKESTKAAGGGSAMDVKDMGAKATEAAKQFTGQFEELKKMADGKLKGVDMTLADLKTKAGAKTGDAKSQIETLMTQLTAKKDEITKMFSGFDMKSLDMKSFEALKAKVEPMVAELTKLLEKAKSM
ncbi:MAG: hypothetical protein NTY35_03395 [Planctomycetota bacterium]|nr:hypothetical protein [Planctomycetota bacterium]